MVQVFSHAVELHECGTKVNPQYVTAEASRTLNKRGCRLTTTCSLLTPPPIWKLAGPGRKASLVQYANHQAHTAASAPSTSLPAHPSSLPPTPKTSSVGLECVSIATCSNHSTEFLKTNKNDKVHSRGIHCVPVVPPKI
jgi:hypothetical protein